tara:strand:- start:472 stop:1506 length:1035 start_codon:yes stop_codon:yes gene_type:complete
MRALSTLLITLIFSCNVWPQAGQCYEPLKSVSVGAWSGVQQEANDARLAVCQYHALASDPNYERATESIVQLHDAILSQKLFDRTVNNIVGKWMNAVVDPQYKLNIYPKISYSPDRDTYLSGTLYLNGKDQKQPDLRYTISARQLVDCKCETALKDLMNLTRDVNYTYTKEHTVNIRDVVENNRQWKVFLEDAREQTYFDIVATTLIYKVFYKNPEGNDFNLPPNEQYFFMRPNIVIENVRAAADGQELKESIALEVLGVNWWKKDACGFFSCGVSVTLNYADRASLESTGWGFMFHIDNTYSLGVSKYGGDTGVYFTIDLLQLFKDKKATYDNYTKSRRKWLN